jgi:hypothetical protein
MGRGSRLVRSGLADGVESDDEAVGIRNLDITAEVPFSRRSVLNPECVEVRAPSDQRRRIVGRNVDP